MAPPTLTVSVVSHRHGALVAALLGDLARHCRESIEVVLTLNEKESLEFSPRDLPFALDLIRNEKPRGFGANHNAAFRRARAEYFCVVNPDIRLETNPFPDLVDVLRTPGVAVAAPLVCNSGGEVEDSARKFPTLALLLRKMMGPRLPLDYAYDAPVIYPDWVAGMFMMFRRDLFESLNGFDERYFLYYEDVDLCARSRAQGLQVALVTTARVVHDARRTSRRNLRHALWHAQSALRYFRTAYHRPP
jgi:GT2 family glycosyltransferase